MAHIYSTWPPFFVTNGPLGPFYSEAGQNTEKVYTIKLQEFHPCKSIPEKCQVCFFWLFFV